MEMKPIAPFTIDFDRLTGMCTSGRAQTTRRYVSNMASQFNDRAAAEEALRSGDGEKMKSLLESILATGDGQALARALSELDKTP